MIRLTLLWMYIAYFGITAWKDWYKSLCALIILTAFVNYPDMPRSMFGLPGISPWNILFLSTFLAWLFDKSKRTGKKKIPHPFRQLIIIQIVIFFVAFIRIYFDPVGLERLRELQWVGLGIPKAGLFNSYFVNTMKWMVPFFMMYSGAIDRNRKLVGLFAILGFYLALALLILKVRSLGSIVNVASLTKGSVKIDRFTGYNRVDASAILAGGSWAALAIIPTQKERWRRAGLMGAFIAIVLGQVVTGGRAGYFAWMIIGCLLAAIRWRKVLLLVPVVALVIVTTIPAIEGRILWGVDKTNHGDQTNISQMTADRNTIWQLALERIEKSPIIGYGRLALRRTGACQEAFELEGEYFGHPHDAYLQFLLDNGIIGLLPLLLFYYLLIKASIVSLRSAKEPLDIAVAGVCFALVSAQLITSLTAQTFYPRSGTLAMWCAIGLFLRFLADMPRTGKTGHAGRSAYS